MIGLKEENILKELSIKSRSLEELSKLMNVSERTIRYKIKEINDSLKYENINVEIVLRKNIVSIVGDLSLLDKINFSKFNAYPITQDERLEILSNILLFGKKKFKLEEYQTFLNISESTAKKDWKELRNRFDKLNIKIINRKFFTALKSNEEIIRNYMIQNIVKYKILSSNLILKDRIINNLIDNYFIDINFDEIENLLNNISSELNITMSDDAYSIIKYTVAIILIRSKDNHISIKNIKNVEFLKNTEEYKIIKKLLPEFNDIFKLDDNLAEFLNLTEYLLGSHSYNFKYSFYENWIHIESIIYKIIEEVGKYLNINFLQDTELFESILNHIKPMIYRIRKGIKLENSITKEIIKESYIVFNALKNNIYILEEFIKCKVDDDELSYLCIFFNLSLKKYVSNIIPRVIIVCSFGYGVSKILEARIKDKFNISIVETLPSNKLTREKILFEKIDMIITTVNIEKIEDISIPIIKIRSPLLLSDDIDLLKKHGLKDFKVSNYYSSLMNIIYDNCDIRDINKLKKDISALLGFQFENRDEHFIDFIGFDNLEIIESVDSLEEAIKIAGNILMKLDYIKYQYIENCIETFHEQGLYMIIGKNTILPHSNDFKSVNKTGYSFVKLKNPFKIKYDDNNYVNIENVILLASSDGKNHRSSLLDLKNMIDEYDLEKSIHGIEDKKEFLEALSAIKKIKYYLG